MKQKNIKKLLLLNLPYFLLGLYATKLGQAYRLATGADLSGKLLHLMEGFVAAFQSPFPSFHPADLLVGVVQELVPEVSGKSTIAVIKPGTDPRTVRHAFIITSF